MLSLTKEQVKNFLAQHNQMVIATYGDHPWIATVYYSFDDDLNLYFLSSPTTLHARHIAENKNIAVAISKEQKITSRKQGLQLYGYVHQITKAELIKHALRHWKDALSVTDPELNYENMIKKVVNGRMYKIIPKKIKLFHEGLFDVDDGEEPTLEL